MSEKYVPNPGSDLAIELGCTCPVVDNNHGKGVNGNFWHTADCPVHSPKPTKGNKTTD